MGDEILDVSRLGELKPGDVLHVRVGITDMGDGMPPFIPGPEELDFHRKEVEAVVPAGVNVLVTHQGVDISVIHVWDNIEVSCTGDDDAEVS
jgi:hypothetical protein